MKDNIGYFHARRMELVAQDGTLEARPHAKGGLTFAYVVCGGVLRYGVARCNPTDHYDKYVGRCRALEALADQAREVPITGDIYTTIYRLITDSRVLRKSMRCALRHNSNV